MTGDARDFGSTKAFSWMSLKVKMPSETSATSSLEQPVSVARDAAARSAPRSGRRRFGRAEAVEEAVGVTLKRFPENEGREGSDRKVCRVSVAGA